MNRCWFFINKGNIIFYIVVDPDQAIYGFTASSPEYYNELYGSEIFQKIEFHKNYRTQNNIFTVVKKSVIQPQCDFCFISLLLAVDSIFT